MTRNVYLINLYNNGAYDSTVSKVFSTKMAAKKFIRGFEYSDFRIVEVPLMSYFDVTD